MLDHLERESLHLGAVQTLLLDEADRMLDMGFFEDIAKVIKLVQLKDKPCFFLPPTLRALTNWPPSS